MTVPPTHRKRPSKAKIAQIKLDAERGKTRDVREQRKKPSVTHLAFLFNGIYNTSLRIYLLSYLALEYSFKIKDQDESLLDEQDKLEFKIATDILNLMLSKTENFHTKEV